MASGSVWVTPWRLPAKMIVAPNSPSPRARASAEAAPRPACGERDRDAGEDAPRARAERPRGGDQVLVDRLERGDRAAEVERALDERDREHDRGLREPDLDPERVELFAEEPDRPNAASSPMPATAGGSTSGSSTSVTTSASPGNRWRASR